MLRESGPLAVRQVQVPLKRSLWKLLSPLETSSWVDFGFQLWRGVSSLLFSVAWSSYRNLGALTGVTVTACGAHFILIFPFELNESMLPGKILEKVLDKMKIVCNMSHIYRAERSITYQ